VLDGNYGNGVGNPLAPASMGSTSLQSVPEPTALGLVAAGVLFGAARRRQRRA
jgi:hypothetical protein